SHPELHLAFGIFYLKFLNQKQPVPVLTSVECLLAYYAEILLLYLPNLECGREAETIIELFDVLNIFSNRKDEEFNQWISCRIDEYLRRKIRNIFSQGRIIGTDISSRIDSLRGCTLIATAINNENKA